MDPSRICDVCTNVRWFGLQPEDVRGTPHHKPRKALEESTKTCMIRKMVLRAAISNSRDSRGIRHRRGYWRQFDAVKYHDKLSVRNVTYIKEMVSCMPESSTDYGAGTGHPVIASTGILDAELKHLKQDDETLGLDMLEIEGSSNSLPVWLYGNLWAGSEPKKQGDVSDSASYGRRSPVRTFSKSL